MADGPGRGAAPAARWVRGAVVVPLYPRVPMGRLRRPGGVIDAAGRPVPGGEVGTYRWTGVQTLPDGVAVADEIPGDAIFGGLTRDHFGHILTNALGRLWLADGTAPDLPLVFIRHQKPVTGFRTLTAVLAAFGIRREVRMIDAPTRVGRLRVGPDLFGERDQARADPAFQAWLETRLPPPGRAHRRVYLTRRQLDPALGRVLGEEAIEAALADAGFETLAPETLTLANQIALYREAAQVVCAEGSAAHLAALALHPEGRLTVIRRRRGGPVLLANHLSTALGPRAAFVDAVAEVWHRPDAPESYGAAELDPDRLRAGLTEAGVLPPGAAWTAPPPALVAADRRAASGGRDLLSDADYHARRRPPPTKDRTMPDDDDAPPTRIDGLPYLRMLGRLHAVLRPEWYFEIGTFRGRSLAHADCNVVAVDPAFQLQRPSIPPNGRAALFFQQTSDDVFASGMLDRLGIRFDLAFLDGLHHFEALLRDFIATEARMAPGGTILIHDVCPSTVAMTAREQCAGNWTGDVWKTLQILIERRPDLDIRVAAAAPTGLAVIRNLDPRNRTLKRGYEKLVADWTPRGFDDVDGGLDGWLARLPMASPEAVLDDLAAAAPPARTAEPAS